MTARRQAGLAQAYDEARPRLVRVAYAVLGSNTDAEDVVSDGWPRLIAADDREPILDLGAWATPTVARLALDLLQSARVRREQYVGPWLPEPIVQGTADPADRVTLDSRSASRRWWCSRRSAPPNGRPGCSTICSGWGSPRLPTSSGGPAARSGRSPPARPAPCRRAVARARPGGCVDQRWRRPGERRPTPGHRCRPGGSLHPRYRRQRPRGTASGAGVGERIDGFGPLRRWNCPASVPTFTHPEVCGAAVRPASRAGTGRCCPDTAMARHPDKPVARCLGLPDLRKRQRSGNAMPRPGRGGRWTVDGGADHPVVVVRQIVGLCPKGRRFQPARPPLPNGSDLPSCYSVIA